MLSLLFLGANQYGSPLPLSAAVFKWGTYPRGRGGAPDWDGEPHTCPGGGGGIDGGGAPASFWPIAGL